MSNQNNQKKPISASKKKNSSEEDSWDKELKIDWRQTKFIGTRTGKYFDPETMRRNTDGFLEFQDSNDTQQTPTAKIIKIRKKLQLQTSQDSSKKQAPLQKISRYNNQRQKAPRVVQKKENYKQKENQKEKRVSRLSDFSFSYEEEKYQHDSEQTSYHKSSEQSIKQQRGKYEQQSFEIKKSEKKKDQSYHLPNNRNFIKKEYQQKQIVQITQNNKNNNKSVGKKKVEQPKIIKNKNQNKSKQNNAKQKLSKGQENSLKNTQQQRWSPNQSLNQIPDRFQDSKSLIKKFPSNISGIKHRRENNSSKNIENNRTVESILSNLEGEIDQVDSLNRAVINTESQNISNQQKKQRYSGNSLKQMGFQKQKIPKIEKNSQTTKNQPILQSQNSEKVQIFTSNKVFKKKILSKKEKQAQLAKQAAFLTKSLRKAASQYYQQQEQQALKEKQQKQKLVRRQLQNKKRKGFHEIQTKDILDFQKLNKENQKIQKKFKPSKKMKTQYENDDFIYSKIRDSQRSSDEEQNRQNENSSEKLSRKQKEIQINNRTTMQVDKKLNKKKRPERISPPKIQKKKISKSKSVQNPLKNKSKQKIEKTKSNPPRIQEYNDNDNGPEQQNNNQQRKYPRRTRVPRLQFWKSQKPIYDSQRKMINVRSNQLYRIVGFVEETFKGDLILEETVQKKGKYVQNITLTRGQIIDFRGFDETYQSLQICIQKRRTNQGNRKNVEVYQDGQLQDLRTSCIVNANTGNFTVQNIGRDTVHLQFTLYINQEEYQP